MERRGFLCAGLLATLVIVAHGCARKTDAGADDADTRSTSRTRVVALSPAIAVTIRDLGRAGTLAGRHGFDIWSDQALPVCGDQSGIDYEALLATNPTHVYVQWGARELPQRLRDLAAEHSWTLRSLNPLALDDVLDMTRTLRADLDGDIATIERLEASLQRLPGIDAARVGRVALWSVSDGSGTGNAGSAGFALLGPGSFHHDILVRLGATPALDNANPFVMLDAEDMVRLAPDAVIVLLPRQPGTAASNDSAKPQVPQALIERLRELGIPAANERDSGIRMALIDDPECLLPGSNVSRVAGSMARALEAWSK